MFQQMVSCPISEYMCKPFIETLLGVLAQYTGILYLGRSGYVHDENQFSSSKKKFTILLFWE